MAATYYEAGPGLAQSGGSELESSKDDGKSSKDTASDIAKRFDIPEALARQIIDLGGKAKVRVPRLAATLQMSSHSQLLQCRLRWIFRGFEFRAFRVQPLGT